MPPRSRVALVLLMGAGLCAVLLAETWWWQGGLVRIPIPLARDGGLPVPVLYWLSIAVYASSYARWFRVPPGARWGRAIQLGCGVHLLVLLAHLVRYLAYENEVVLSSAYLRYWQAVWTAALALGAAGVAAFMTGWRRARRADPWLWFAPLVGGYAVFWVSSWSIAPPLALGAAVGGVGLAAASRGRLLRAGWVRLGGLAATERVFLAVVFLGALALRLFYTSRVMTNPDFLNTGSDGPLFDALAWALVQGQPAPESVPWWAMDFFVPGYVRFVALIYWLVGRSYFAVCAVQSVIGAWACLLMYAVANRLFGRSVARLAAVFGAVSFPMIFAAAAIGHQAMDLFWTLAVVWCLLRYLDDPTRWGRWIIGVGLLLGWAAVTREGNIVFWLFLIGWFLLGMRARLGWRRAILHVTGLSLGFFIMVVPFVGGAARGLRPSLDWHWFYRQHTSTNINAWFNPWRDPEAASALFREHPLDVVAKVSEAMVGNFTAVFLNQDYGAFDPVFLVRGSPYYFGMWWYAYCLAFVGLGLLLRQAWRAPIEQLGWWLIVGLLVSRTAVHLFLEAAYRHRAPLEPYLIMLAAYGLTQLLRAARDGDRRGRCADVAAPPVRAAQGAPPLDDTRPLLVR